MIVDVVFDETEPVDVELQLLQPVDVCFLELDVLEVEIDHGQD